MPELPIIKNVYVGAILNSITFYVGWFACIASGVEESKYFGVILALLLVTAHLILISQDPKKELKLIGITAVIGLIVDSAFINFDILVVDTPNPFNSHIAPLWILGAYMIFATTINNCLKWLADRVLLCILFGGTGGLASYYAGIRIGAASFGSMPEVSSIVIFIVWA